MAAPVYPPQANQALYITDHQKVRELYDADFRFQLDDYSNINTMRGPTQGYPAGGVRYGRRGR